MADPSPSRPLYYDPGHGPWVYEALAGPMVPGERGCSVSISVEQVRRRLIRPRELVLRWRLALAERLDVLGRLLRGDREE